MILGVDTASEQAFLSFWEQSVRSSLAAYEVLVSDRGPGAQEAGVLHIANQLLHLLLPWAAPALLSFPGSQTEL